MLWDDSVNPWQAKFVLARPHPMPNREPRTGREPLNGGQPRPGRTLPIRRDSSQGHPIHQHRAFSLVELIVVMVILGLLAGLVAVRTRGYLVSSKQNAAKAEISNLVKAIETFYADQGRYPTTDEGIAVLASGTSSWPDGFINKVPNDPWGNPYEYFSPGGGGEPFEVVSLGADGREGGDGENQDHSSLADDS